MHRKEQERFNAIIRKERGYGGSIPLLESRYLGITLMHWGNEIKAKANEIRLKHNGMPERRNGAETRGWEQKTAKPCRCVGQAKSDNGKKTQKEV